jgi:protein TonB
MLMDLINRGKVYRFLLKPVSPGRSRLAIEASVKHHLEAPDSAFKVSGQAAAAPKPEPKAKPAAEPAPKPQPAAKQSKPKAVARASAKPAPKPGPKPAAAAGAKAPKPAADIVANRDDALSPVDEGLGDAFGGSDTSFTETVTGIVETVTRSLKPKKTDKQPAPKASASASAMAIEPSAATDGSGGSLFTDPKILGIGAVALVAVASIGIWALSGSDEQPVGPGAATPALEERAPVTQPAGESVLQTEVVVPETLGLDELIDEARQLAAAGRIYAPRGNNAIELYLAALESAPGDPVAQQGLDEAINESMGIAEAALLERRGDDALAAIEGIELGSPGNPRLPFLRAQLSQIQLRQSIDGARAAIRESRFEDAQSAIAAARGLEVADTAEIDAVEQELSAALANQRVDEVLAKANARLDAGNLITPANDNARYYFELALSNDPGNRAARQGLDIVASRLVLQAREQIDRGNFEDAEALLTDARRLDPSSSDLAASTVALSDARQRRAEEIQSARERAAADRAPAERAPSQRAAAEQPTAAQTVAAAAPAEAAPSEPEPAAEEPASEPAPQQVQAARPLNNAAVAGSGDAVENRVAEPEASTRESAPVAASSLQRTRYVAPRYPRGAQRRGLSGWVDVLFTVDIDGSVIDVSVRDSNPGDTFVNSAVNAVEKWEFEPVIEDGVAIQKRAAVRMMFAIE